MAYTLEERETIVRYDEMDNCWYFESNVRKHITKIMKTIDSCQILGQEKEDDLIIWIHAKLTNLDDYMVSPFVRKRVKREMTEEQREEARKRMARLHSKSEI
ncbi:TPA: hypothetical protein ACG2KK_001828 [Streptococcus agalactiae]